MKTLIRRAYFVLPFAGSLLIVWVVIPILRGRGSPSAAIIITATGAGALIWFGVASLFTVLILLSFGWLWHATSARMNDQRTLFKLTEIQLNEGVALLNRRGKLRWINNAGKPLFVESPHKQMRKTSLRPEIKGLADRVRVTKRAALQSLAIGDQPRCVVQALPLASGIALIARPISGDASQNQFYERFLQRVVHDMRNPLAAIIAHAGNIAAAPQPDLRAVGVIESEALRLTKLVDSLLFDARLSYVPLAAERLDLVDLLEEVIYLFEERAMREGKTLESETPPDGAMLEADRDLLLRALSNLVDNSLKYTTHGGVIRLAVEPKTDQEMAQWVVTVADNGDGIPPEFLPDRIFEPLVRVRHKNTVMGSGLGLSIVKKIVELHGGHVTALSTPGQGTTITLWLPQ